MHLRRAACAAAVLACLAAGLPAASTVTGRIHDAAGRPLQDVAVVAAGAAGLRASSDERGEFALTPPAAGTSLRLTFELRGYHPETVLYEVKDPPDVLDVVLTPSAVPRQEIRVVASRLDVPLKETPAATSVVGADMLEAMPRGVAIDEPLQAVPGVKVDNQANGERVHLSIRGQGILSERGIRGIQVLYDGVPLNDPSGFCPDVYDVDWAGVEEVHVVRGPVAFLYGGGSAGGVIDVRTSSERGPFHGGVSVEGGSNGFYKTRGEIAGTAAGVAYLISAARTAGDGYREHTAFWGDNVYARLGLAPKPSLRLNPFLFATGFFNQNAEGLNLAWGWPSASWWTMANPDSLTYNEYQRTYRVTGGFQGTWQATEKQNLSFTFYARHTAYKEPVPSSVEHRDIAAPGGSLQYEAEAGSGAVRNHFSTGLDLDGQWVDDLRYPNLGNAVEGPDLLANQAITQSRAGGYVTDRLRLGGKWTLLAGFRFDRLGNSVSDALRAGGLDLSGSQNFRKATGRAGVTRSLARDVSLFASWGQGFLPPATEELYANPVALGGFNRALKPATSMGEEVGARGSLGSRVFWETDVFRLDTKNDFERYRIDSRPLETFYANAGETRRYGLETQLKWLPARRVTVTGAYTYSHFVYTHYDSLTYPGNLVGKRLPNSPGHQAFVAASLDIARHWTLGASIEAESLAYVDPTNLTWIDGYGLLDARLSRNWQHRFAHGSFFVAGKNLTGKRYIAFSEPDPDGNSYQPGANREVFAGMQIRF